MSAPPFDLTHTLEGPSAQHWLGFDAFGRDLLQLLVSSAFASIGFAILSLLLSFSLALAFSSVTLSFGKRLHREALIRAADFFLAFPSLLIALSFAAVWGPGKATLLCSLIAGALPGLTRILLLRGMEAQMQTHYEAARALGAGVFHLWRRYDLPELLRIARLKIPGFFAHAILAEATLSFLGVGAPIGSETWGSLLAQGKDYLIEAPRIAWVSGIPLFVLILWIQTRMDRET